MHVQASAASDNGCWLRNQTGGALCSRFTHRLMMPFSENTATQSALHSSTKRAAVAVSVVEKSLARSLIKSRSGSEFQHRGRKSFPGMRSDAAKALAANSGSLFT